MAFSSNDDGNNDETRNKEGRNDRRVINAVLEEDLVYCYCGIKLVYSSLGQQIT
ncbi:conserved hypothetical protein [Ricinus communis]|uniref:Uncharacterized protein n=1 Tax=Ricinus communis TaxID=3988 RepID=B9SUA6_RICCO|nr:conserved hypothetical protein [Ricinus communis]